VDPGNFLLSVSCPTESLCVAGDDAGNVVSSTDPAGGAGAWRVSHVASGDYPYLNGLSCPTESLCVAVDAAGNAFTTADPTGGASKWSAASIDGNGLTAVSCASENLCVAVDVAGNVVSSTNPRGGSGAWASAPADVPAVLLGVSCPSTSLCVAVDASGNAITSTDPAGGGGAWSRAAVDTTGNNALVGVSCTSDQLCVAVDDAGNAVSSTNPTGGPSAWSTANLGTEPLNSVSCSDASLCVAVDTRGHAVIGSGSRSGIGLRSQAGDAGACGAVDSFNAATARAAGRGLRFDLARTAGGPVDVRVYRETEGRRVIPSRLIAQMTGRKRVLDWGGQANVHKRRVSDGYYAAALRARSGRSTELRQLAFLRRHGRFSARPAFATELGCGVLGSFSLGKPVFGGSSSWPLSVHYKLRRKARVGITVARGKHVVRRLRTRTQSGGSHRVRLAPRNLRPGDYRVDLTVERDGTTTRHQLFARRL
jgi:hypothetical protein